MAAKLAMLAVNTVASTAHITLGKWFLHALKAGLRCDGGVFQITGGHFANLEGG
jgi:hypothetical protein